MRRHIYIYVYTVVDYLEEIGRVGSDSATPTYRGFEELFYHWLVARILFSISNVCRDLVLISNNERMFDEEMKFYSFFFLELLENICNY